MGKRREKGGKRGENEEKQISYIRANILAKCFLKKNKTEFIMIF
jgi:hypothetical protein